MIILELVLVIFIRIVIRVIFVKIVCLIFVNDMCKSKLSKIEVGWK